jgi:hypothetical protein
MSFATHVGREATIQALGRTWRLSRWTRRVWMEWLDWLRSRLPNPIEGLLRHIDQVVLKDADILRELQRKDEEERLQTERYNQAEQEQARREGRTPVLRRPVLLAPQWRQNAEVLVRLALDQSMTYLSVNSPVAKSALESPEGISQLLYLLLREHHPEVTPDDAYEIICDLMQRPGGREEWEAAVNKVQGVYLGGKKEEVPAGPAP